MREILRELEEWASETDRTAAEARSYAVSLEKLAFTIALLHLLALFFDATGQPKRAKMVFEVAKFVVEGHVAQKPLTPPSKTHSSARCFAERCQILRGEVV